MSQSTSAPAASQISVQPVAQASDAQPSLIERYTDSAQQALQSTKTGFEALAEKGASFLGIKYRYGGNGPESGGFDCSGLVRKVFADALGLNLPRTAAEMSKLGDKVGRSEMKPGDLVFFHTLRRTFSHVGIYLGDNRFLHAPSKGSTVRVDSMDNTYWSKRFSGARRLMPEADAAILPPASPPGNLPVVQTTTVDTAGKIQ
ncbi:MAG TPA: C40 family peptidase [Rhodocyclaceae bacterium]|nr:C40 family peptidase [Rhodocyclaceae bacterium]